MSGARRGTSKVDAWIAKVQPLTLHLLATHRGPCSLPGNLRCKQSAKVLHLSKGGLCHAMSHGGLSPSVFCCICITQLPPPLRQYGTGLMKHVRGGGALGVGGWGCCWGFIPVTVGECRVAVRPYIVQQVKHVSWLQRLAGMRGTDVKMQ
jgi:hypothetical protein